MSDKRFIYLALLIAVVLLCVRLLMSAPVATVLLQNAYGDAGQYAIVSAQYGTAEHHVDVTSRLRELAAQDRPIQVNNTVMGGDPDAGQRKVLRIYAVAPNGQERMFEYAEGGTVNGALFTNWRSGSWNNGAWSGRWEGNPGYGAYGYGEPQPHMNSALQRLQEARTELVQAAKTKGGHRQRALDLVNQAIAETEAGIQYDNTH